MRTDGAYIEAGEQDNLIVQKLQEDPTAYGIFGFSYLDQNSDALQGAVIDGTNPTLMKLPMAAIRYPGRCISTSSMPMSALSRASRNIWPNG